MTRVAFCFLTCGDLHQTGIWRPFFEPRLSRCQVYFHNKRPLDNAFFAPFQIADPLPTRYGHISLVKATLKLFEAAWQDPLNSHFALLSESCIPLHGFDEISERILSQPASVIAETENVGKRIKYLTRPDYFRDGEFSKQSQWMILHRDALPVLSQHDVTDSVFGNRVFAADEHYFISLFRHLGLPFVNQSVTSVDWTQPVVTKNPYHYGPRVYESLDAQTIQAARAEGNLFLRKVSPRCVVPDRLIES